MKTKEIISVALRLFIITAVATLCLAAVNMVTKPIIDKNAIETQKEIKMKVLPEAKDFKKLSHTSAEAPEAEKMGVSIKEFNVALDEKSNSIGYVITAVSNAGYGGDITVMVGLDKALKVTRVQISESNETAGLGANAEKPDFINQYIGKTGGLEVVKGQAKSENQISAIASATVTSKAVTACVNSAVELMENKIAKGFDPDEVSRTNAIVDEKSKISQEQLKNSAQQEQTGGAN